MEPTNETFVFQDAGLGFRVVQSLQVVIGLFGFGGNLLSFIILKRRFAKNQTNFLLINQSLVDLITSAILTASTCSDMLEVQAPSRSTPGYMYCLLWASDALLWSLFAISTFNLTVISIERYIAVLHPVWYKANFKRSTTFKLAVLCWIFAPLFTVAYGIATVSYQDEKCMMKHSPAVNVLSICLFFWEYLFPMCIMSFSFAAIARKFWQMNRVDADRVNRASAANTAGQPEPCDVAGTSGSHNLHSKQSQDVSMGNEAMEMSAMSRKLKRGIEPRDKGSGNMPNRAGPSRIEPRRDDPDRRQADEQGNRPNAAVLRRLNTTKVLLIVYLAFIIMLVP